MSVTLQLRTRLAIAGALLIGTTVATGVWSVTAFREVSQVVGQTVTDNERMTDATARLSGALEREDDAVLLAFSDLAQGEAELVRQRERVAGALGEVAGELDAPAEREIAARLRADVDAYQRAVDELIARANAVGARMRYHEDVNPLLRRAVATTNQIRDQHFRSSQAVAEWAGARSTRSMEIVGAISVAALLLLCAIVLHLVRVVMVPLRELTRAVEAIRRGDFSRRVGMRRDDELGRLGAGLDRMTDELEQFRRANIGEVIRAKETLEATLEALPDAVVVVDPDRRISAANPRALEALGEPRSRSLDELDVPATTRDAIAATLEAGTTSGTAVDLSNTIELAIAGGPRKLLPRVVPIEGQRGAVLVLSDVTDLARLDEMRLELVAVASHELRTPLTTLRMTLAMMQERGQRHDARDRELLATALVGVEQLAARVDEFLDLTQIEAGQLRLAWSPLSLGELVEHAARAIAPACEAAGIALDAPIYPELSIALPGDRARLAMALSNLLSNAVKYTPSGGRIEIHTAIDRGRGTATIEVSDSGPGVPPAYRERVFERFFRIEHLRGGEIRSAGTGIGLYIARQVLEAHGGAIRCDASPLGGARFAMTLRIDP